MLGEVLCSKTHLYKDRFYTHENVGWKHFLPEQEMHTTAFWLQKLV